MLAVLAGCTDVTGSIEGGVQPYLAVPPASSDLARLAAVVEAGGGVIDQRFAAVGVLAFRATVTTIDTFPPGTFELLEPVTVRTGDPQRPAHERRLSLDTETVPWGVARVGGPGARSSHTLWVLDGGVDPTHRDLVVDAARSYDAIVALGGEADADLTHGTAVAGVAAALANDRDVVGVAPGTRVASVRVLDANESGSIDALVAGLDHVARRAEPGDVANLSLSERTGDESAVLAHAIRRVADRIAIVVAAGNRRQTVTGIATIAHGNVYTVSAIDEDDCLATFSNYGAGVDLAAPGRNILTLAPGDTTAVYDGTSFAAPHVAGLLLGGRPVADGQVCGDPDGHPEAIAHR